jgi:hypothetical protein
LTPATSVRDRLLRGTARIAAPAENLGDGGPSAPVMVENRSREDADCAVVVDSKPTTITLRGTEILLLRYRVRSAVVDWSIRRATRVITVAENRAARAVTRSQRRRSGLLLAG